MNVAITGIAGYLACGVAQKLIKDPGVSKILGIDVRAVEPQHDKIVQLRMDVRDTRLTEVFVNHKIDTVLHFAWMFRPTHNRQLMHDIDVNGTRNVLRACAEAGVDHIVIPGSTTTYGAHPDNPPRLTEDSPLRPNAGVSYSLDKFEVENLCGEFEREHKDIVVTRLRACTVGGPNVHDFIRDSFTRWGAMIKGHDPEIQFIHKEDVVRLLHSVVLQKPQGIFNATPDDAILVSEIASALGRPTRAYPEGLLTRLVAFAWLLRLSPQPAPYLQLIKHSWVASNEKIRHTIGFQPSYSSRDALKAMKTTVLKS